MVADCWKAVATEVVTGSTSPRLVIVEQFGLPFARYYRVRKLMIPHNPRKACRRSSISSKSNQGDLLSVGMDQVSSPGLGSAIWPSVR